MDVNINNSNIPKMSPEKLISELSGLYGDVISSGLPVKTVPSVMLWGAPGVGKSQAVRQTAAEISRITGKKTVVTDVRLLLFNPIDLRGIPTANAEKTLAVWLKPKIFLMDESEDTINILFLDEISAAPQSVQAAAYQITLDRVIGEHRLPENCIVIAAGNRITDKSVAFKMPKAHGTPCAFANNIFKFYFVIVTLLSALGLSGLFPIAHDILHASICAKSANANIVISSPWLKSKYATFADEYSSAKLLSFVTTIAGAESSNILSIHFF